MNDMRIEIDNISRNFPLILETFIFVDGSNYAIITFGRECRYIGVNNYVVMWWILDVKENPVSLNEIYIHVENLIEKYGVKKIYINKNEMLETYFSKLNLTSVTHNVEEILPFAKGILKDERVNVPSAFKENINKNLKNYNIENQNTLTNCLVFGLSKLEIDPLTFGDDIEKTKILAKAEEYEGAPSPYFPAQVIFC